MGVSSKTSEPSFQKGYRLINTKHPTIKLFDDVANPEDFELLYQIQSLTNPRLKDPIGEIELIDPNEVPYQCERGKSYAIAPFTHITPQGGRFNDGLFGALYIASNSHTAASEVKYHQQQYWQNIEGLAYDRLLFRVLVVSHIAAPINEVAANDNIILDPDNYSASQQLARKLKKENYQAVQYPSVRATGGTCWALFTPKPINEVIQANLVEVIWDGEQISEVNTITSVV